MKSSSFYARKAADFRELGRWQLADEFTAKAAKARKAEKKRKATAAGTCSPASAA